MNPRASLALLLVLTPLIAGLVSCSSPRLDADVIATASVQSYPQVARVHLVDRALTREQIDSLLSWIAKAKEGWSFDSFTTRVPAIYVMFFDREGVHIGSVNISPGLIVEGKANGGGARCRALTESEYADLLRLVGVKDGVSSGT